MPAGRLKPEVYPPGEVRLPAKASVTGANLLDAAVDGVRDEQPSARVDREPVGSG